MSRLYVGLSVHPVAVRVCLVFYHLVPLHLQQFVDMPEGRRFRSLYKPPADYPYLAIIDPFTGQKVRFWARRLCRCVSMCVNVALSVCVSMCVYVRMFVWRCVEMCNDLRMPVLTYAADS